jgi:aryl-alcohol dehydrogenase-like predicted oxidoreductase
VDYRQLGGSGLRVSVLALGTMTFGDAGTAAAIGGLTSREGRALVDQAVEAGFNLIDTADIYSGGRSEEILYPYWLQAKTASDRLSPGDLTLLGGRHP